MIKLTRPSEESVLDGRTSQSLEKQQTKASLFSVDDPAIQKSWKNFRRGKSCATVLKVLIHSFRWKCAYCETVNAADIDHFYPKSTYPDRMFLWENFLLSCKNCNHSKGERFPIDGGKPRLLDPCADDPLEYFRWNLETGQILPHPESAKALRATATRDCLDLDSEVLRKERAKKVREVLRLLAGIVRETPISDELWQAIRDHLEPESPWLGIIRQLFRYPDDKYKHLIDAAQEKLPAIVDIIQVWL